MRITNKYELELHNLKLSVCSDNGDLDVGEETKCLRVVRRVLDEETVLGMVIAFLQLTHDDSIPQSASIAFTSCFFDKESGIVQGRYIHKITYYFAKVYIF